MNILTCNKLKENRQTDISKDEESIIELDI